LGEFLTKGYSFFLFWCVFFLQLLLLLLSLQLQTALVASDWGHRASFEVMFWGYASHFATATAKCCEQVRRHSSTKTVSCDGLSISGKQTASAADAAMMAPAAARTAYS